MRKYGLIKEIQGKLAGRAFFKNYHIGFYVSFFLYFSSLKN